MNTNPNRYQNFDRPYYHTSKGLATGVRCVRLTLVPIDLVKTLDLAYGTGVAKLAIETVAQLANSVQ